MLKKLIEISIRHLSTQLSDISELKKKIDSLDKEIFNLIKERDDLNIQISELEKEYSHNLFLEILSIKYKGQVKLIRDLKQKVDKINENISELTKIKNEEKARLTQLVARKKEIKNRIEELNNPKKAAKLFINKFPDNLKSGKFMMDVVEVDAENIIYDKSDFKGVYLLFLEQLKKHVIDSVDCNMEYLSAIEYAINCTTGDQPNTQDTGYKIPVKYMYEAVRYSVSKGGIKNNLLLEKYIKLYNALNSKCDIEYGKLLEYLYDNEYVEPAFYEIKKDDNTSCFQDRIKRYFELGISADNVKDYNSAPCIKDMTRISHVNESVFLDMLSFVGKESLGHLIIQLPKNGIDAPGHEIKTTIWGVEKNEDGTLSNNYFLLPKNIKGYIVYDNDNNDITHASFVPREGHIMARKYNTHIYDGSISPQIKTRIVRADTVDR